MRHAMKANTNLTTLIVLVLALLTGCLGQEIATNSGSGSGTSAKPSAGGDNRPAGEGASSSPEQVDEPVPESESGSNAEAPGEHDAGEQPDAELGPYSVLAERLRIPWSISFAGDGDDIYISEREGAVVRIGADGSFARKPVRTEKDVYARGEGGFLGFVLSPDFDRTGQAYAYHTYRESGATLNRIVLLEEQSEAWVEIASLLESIPGGNTHDGGRLVFGPDGYLYATTGDAGQAPLAQQPDSLAGKILRMTTDGDVPEDNPFSGSYVYSYGHRNPQGIAWNDQGEMYSSEHGPSGRPGGHDEINVIVPGSNYGWPVVYGDAESRGMVPPVYHSGDPAIAPSGVAFDASQRLLLATLRGTTLYRYDPASGAMEAILEGEGRLRDVKVYNGRTYVITNNTDGRGSPSAVDDRLLVLNGD